MRNKRDQIKVKYYANPNKAESKCHKDSNPENLVWFRTRKFKPSQYKKAWDFIARCDKPITTLKQILWAFPKDEAIHILALEAVEENEINHVELTEAKQIADMEMIQEGLTLEEELQELGIL